MEETVVCNLLIQHEGYRVTSVQIASEDLRHVIRSAFDSISLQINTLRPDQGTVALPNCYSDLFSDVFDAVGVLHTGGDACLAAFLATFLFDSVTPMWKALIDRAQHLLAIHLWTAILGLAADWEQRSAVLIHKGSPYAFLAYTYLMIGDFDSAFSYIYNAIEEDRRLGSACPTINYPAEAPVYMTATLRDSQTNLMWPNVAAIRDAIQSEIAGYDKRFGRAFSLDDFDTQFLRNPRLEAVAFFFVFTFWSVVEHRKRVDLSLMSNDFSRLKNARWLFGLCLVVDRLLHEHPDYTDKYISGQIAKFVEKRQLMPSCDLSRLICATGVASAHPDNLLPGLLSGSLIHENRTVPLEVQHLFVAWNLRNYAAHNINTKRVIGEQFDGIVSALLYCIFLILEQYTY